MCSADSGLGAGGNKKILLRSIYEKSVEISSKSFFEDVCEYGFQIM